MTNCLERVTRMALGAGAFVSIPDVRYFLTEGEFIFTKKQLLAFEQAVLATRDEEHTKSLAKLLLMVATGDEQIQSLQEEVERMSANLALFTTFIKPLALYGRVESRDADTAKMIALLATTKADVDNWMAKKKAEWEKGVWLQASELASRNLYDNKQYAELFVVMANKVEV